MVRPAESSGFQEFVFSRSSNFEREDGQILAEPKMWISVKHFFNVLRFYNLNIQNFDDLENIYFWNPPDSAGLIILSKKTNSSLMLV